MISRRSSSSKRFTTPRTTNSNPENALDHIEELLYTTKLSDTTSDLKRPRAASGSALLADGLETSPKTNPKHIYGQSCPEHNKFCHYHHQLTQHCHIPWYECITALNAIKQSYRAGADWVGAPERWNKDHESCIKTQKKCDIHAGMQGLPIEKQRNKKYPEKPRTRGRHSRGSSNQKKGGNDT